MEDALIRVLGNIHRLLSYLPLFLTEHLRNAECWEYTPSLDPAHVQVCVKVALRVYTGCNFPIFLQAAVPYAYENKAITLGSENISLRPLTNASTMMKWPDSELTQVHVWEWIERAMCSDFVFFYLLSCWTKSKFILLNWIRIIEDVITRDVCSWCIVEFL